MTVDLETRVATATSTGTLSVTLLDTFRACHAGQELCVQEAGQRLLACLALLGPRRRPSLAGLLMPDIQEDVALRRLRSALSRVRRQARDIVASHGDYLALGPRVRVDVEVFDRTARDVLDDERQLTSVELDRAYSCLTRNQLLVGWYDDWVVTEQERLAQLAVHALEALSRRYLDTYRHLRALESALAAVRIDPLRESAHRAIMATHIAEGNPAAAIRQYSHYQGILERELGGAKPSDAMVRVLASISAPTPS